jgi:hypothetical protein
MDELSQENSGDLASITGTDPLNPGWFDEDRIKSLREQFDTSSPYTHLVLPELCSRSALVQARSEIIDNVVAKYKETDLFKVHAPTLRYV